MLVGELLVIGERTAAASRKVGLLWCGQSPNVSFNVLCGVPAAVKYTKVTVGVVTVLQLGRAGWPLTLENSILTNDDSFGWWAIHYWPRSRKVMYKNQYPV